METDAVPETGETWDSGVAGVEHGDGSGVRVVRGQARVARAVQCAGDAANAGVEAGVAEVALGCGGGVAGGHGVVRSGQW